MKREFSRRDFLRVAGAFSAMSAIGGLPSALTADERRLAQFPEKTSLILLTSRPPQLETPLAYFNELITPNDAVFVRWHLSSIPTSVNLSEWRLKVGGNTERQLELSMDDLRRFEKVSYTAVMQCSGNGRSFFSPRVPGGQWKNRAMANVTWSGVRLKDILNRAGIKAGSVDISFDGLDAPPLPSVPDLVKSLPVDKAMEDDIIVAYEMNGKYLPMLNGFPARLIVPGWYATYWVKSLKDITVLSKPFEGFWMKTAYRIPDNPCGCLLPGSPPGKTVPINKMTTRSIIVNPPADAPIEVNKPFEISGIAFSGGYGVRDALVSVDGGRVWNEARLGKDLGKYSWVRWRYPWRPEKAGAYTLMARATNSVGESQPLEGLWNPSGFLWNKIERIEVMVR
ncbi:MAG TPA: molybdopterin-dependent oxidoreductase [Thermodesulfovibrionales bacterium]|nr:molybdopterin-dependent oxidoreductase [Thermodesulfovibrionales bacterium]